MKRLFTLFATLSMLLCGCASFEEQNNTVTLPATHDLQAGFAEDTRTYVENNKYLRWHEDDRLTAFYGNTLNRQYKFNGKTGANSGTFSLVPSGELGTGNAFDRIYAVYPYNETATITDEGEISLTLPAVQSYAENSFGKGANTMVAVTENLEDTFLAFKNACGYLKLKLYGDNVTLASIEVKGNNNEKIAGAATATIAFGEAPQLTMADDATAYVTIDYGEGVTLGTTAETATEFWIVLPETTFEGGITITATDTDGKVFEKSTSKTVAVVRNEIQPMAAIEAICVKVQPKNTIYYTATQKVEPYDETVFGATYQSSEWDSETGEGVITFDGELTTIGDEAFAYCDSLTSVTIPDSVTTIGKSAFNTCSSLTSVTIPDSVTTIGVQAFMYCRRLTSVTIGDSVTTIGSAAFFDCRRLTSVTIPDSVTTIGEAAFVSCSNLAEFKGKFAADGGRCLIKDNTIITYAEASGTTYTIPDSVTTIGGAAFDSCSSLTSVTIPDSVTTIGNYAFRNCSSLTSVYCEATTPPTLGYDVFDDNASGRKIYVPAESVEAYKAATNWSNYASYIVGYDFETGEEVIVVKSELFYTATAKVEPYKSSAFNVAIVSNEWNEATGEGIITFNGELTTIGMSAFYGRSSLTSVTIGDSVMTIGNAAFCYCYSLTSVYCEATTPPTLGGSTVFDNNASGRKIYVPAESVEEYKAATNWSEYAADIVGYDFE